MTDYVYNDDDGKMPALLEKFTSRIGDGTGHHEQAYPDMLNPLACAMSTGSGLDIGCGMGRNTQAMAERMAEVVALEPDQARWTWTRDTVADQAHVSVLNMTTTQYMAQQPGKQFDLVLAGMVVQHIATHTCRDLIEDVAALTKPGRLAVIATTHAPAHTPYFTLQGVNEPRHVAQISEAEFNDFADNPQGKDRLPVRRFSRADLEAQVPDSFDIVHWSDFSYYRPEHLEYFAWIHGVTLEELADTGTSQFIVLKKVRS